MKTKTATNQPKHTQEGKLKISEYSNEVNIIRDEEGKQFAMTLSQKGAKEHAQRIVKGVNLLSNIEKEVALLDKHSTDKIISPNGIILLAVYKQLLKQAEQK